MQDTKENCPLRRPAKGVSYFASSLQNGSLTALSSLHLSTVALESLILMFSQILRVMLASRKSPRTRLRLSIHTKAQVSHRIQWSCVLGIMGGIKDSAIRHSRFLGYRNDPSGTESIPKQCSDVGVSQYLICFLFMVQLA